MEQKLEFLRLAGLEGSNRRELCRRFKISPQTGYKWLARVAKGEGCEEQSRRPLNSPALTSPDIEAAVLKVRDEHPAWGARKIAAVLEREQSVVPATSTIHAILTRHERIVPPRGGGHAKIRFERQEANELWQMDFKGRSRLSNGSQLHPLTIVDDHSRFALCIAACGDETGKTVKSQLESVFRLYGLPQAFFVDNGTPWGDAQGAAWTKFGVWLLKLGINLIHARPYHPQSRGKNERFHRSMDDEVFAMRPLRDHADAQRAFDHWRNVYNFERPHEGLGFVTPSQRYRASPRSVPAKLPQIVYGQGDIVRHISTTKGYIVFKGHNWKVPEAFCGEHLAIRPQAKDGQFGVYFGANHIRTIDLNTKKSVNYVSEHLSTMSPG